MKRIVSLVTVVALSIGILAGCGGQKNVENTPAAATATATATAAPEAKKDPVKMVWWGAIPPENGPQEVADNFNKLDPNVQVEYYRYVNDEQGNVKLDMSLAAGEQIDIFVNYGPNRREQRINFEADITDLCKKYDIDLTRDFGDAAKPNIGADGKIRTIPTIRLAGLVLVNKKMFDDAGIPIPTDWTYDDVREISKKLSKGEGADKVYGYVLKSGRLIQDYLSSMYNQDAWLNKDATASRWKELPEVKQGFQLWSDMMYVDKSTMAWEDMTMQKIDGSWQTPFFTNKIALLQTGSSTIRDVKDTAKYPRDFVVAFAPVPKVSKTQEKYYAPIEPYDDFAVNVNCKNQDEAVQFIKWYYSEGFDPMIKGGRLPLYNKYDADKIYKLISTGAENVMDEKSFKEVVFGQYATTQLPGSNKGRAEIEKLIKDESEIFFVKGKNVDQLIDNLQTKTDEILKNAK